MFFANWTWLSQNIAAILRISCLVSIYFIMLWACIPIYRGVLAFLSALNQNTQKCQNSTALRTVNFYSTRKCQNCASKFNSTQKCQIVVTLHMLTRLNLQGAENGQNSGFGRSVCYGVSVSCVPRLHRTYKEQTLIALKNAQTSEKSERHRTAKTQELGYSMCYRVSLFWLDWYFSLLILSVF